MDWKALLALNVIGIGMLLTQNRYTAQQAADGNLTWAAYMVASLLVGAVAAGIWALARKPAREQTAKHFVITAWVVAGLLTLGSYQ